MIRSITLCALFLSVLLSGCDESGATDAGLDAAIPDAGAGDGSVEADGGAADAGPSDAGPVDSGPSDDAGPSDAGPLDAGPSDAGPSDAGPSDAGPSDAGPSDAGPSGCPCFGAGDIATIGAHGGTLECATGINEGTVIRGRFVSTVDAQSLQVDVQEISGFAGLDWFCGAGCNDLNDDLVDDCAGAALGAYMSRMITESEHDACEALIAARCE